MKYEEYRDVSTQQLTDTELSVQHRNSCWYSAALTHNHLRITCSPTLTTAST